MRAGLALFGSIVVSFGVITEPLLSAHHSFSAEFDINKPVKVQGTLTKVDWINPHSWFHVAVKNANGQVEEWMFEAGNPNVLTRRGWNKNSLPIGAQVVVEGYMSKGVPRRANGRVMKFLDGRTLFVGSSGGDQPHDANDSSAK